MLTQKQAVGKQPRAPFGYVVLKQSTVRQWQRCSRSQKAVLKLSKSGNSAANNDLLTKIMPSQDTLS